MVILGFDEIGKPNQHNLIDPDSPRDIGYFIHGTEKLHWKQVRSFLSKRYDILEEVTKLQSFKVASPTIPVIHLPSPDPFISKNISERVSSLSPPHIFRTVSHSQTESSLEIGTIDSNIFS